MKHVSKKLLLVVLSCISLTLFAQGKSMNTHMSNTSNTSRVTLDDMQTALAKNSAVVIDIREPVEHATGVAKGAALIPLSVLGKRLSEIPKPTDPTFYIVCNTQNRSARVVEQLQSMGYNNVQYVHGGMSEWNARKLPTVKPAN
jgi:rhodanese-related sulfurtransferase